METIFNEPSDTSISASIANFFSSWQELSKNPTDVGSKDIAIQNAKYLADNISNIKNKLNVSIVSEDVLGSCGRTIVFDTLTNKLKVKSVGKGEKFI